jgi:hypothetical protein
MIEKFFLARAPACARVNIIYIYIYIRFLNQIQNLMIRSPSLRSGEQNRLRRFFPSGVGENVNDQSLKAFPAVEGLAR